MSALSSTSEVMPSARISSPSGRDVLAAGIGQAVADDVVEAIDLVAEDMAVGAEQVAVIEAGAGKGPVLRAIDRKAAHAARRAAAPAGIEAVRGVEAEGHGAGPADFRRFPGIGGAGDVAGLV